MDISLNSTDILDRWFNLTVQSGYKNSNNQLHQYYWKVALQLDFAYPFSFFEDTHELLQCNIWNQVSFVQKFPSFRMFVMSFNILFNCISFIVLASRGNHRFFKKAISQGTLQLWKVSRIGKILKLNNMTWNLAHLRGAIQSKWNH